MASSSQPNTTLYINNLNEKVNKEELRSQLFALFTTYGKIIDIVASKSKKMRGQAFLVFTDLAGATSAMRACEGMTFYDKPMRIDYAKSKSWATLRREDPLFVPPTSTNTTQLPILNGTSQKRLRDEDGTDGEPQSKREKADDDDAEEMEIDEEEEQASTNSKGKFATIPASVQQPTQRLLCTNLPQEVTDGVLSVLFSQYQGFQTTHVVQSPTPNAANAKVKMAQVLFDTPDLASVAKEALDGFALKKGWVMAVAYI